MVAVKWGNVCDVPGLQKAFNQHELLAHAQEHHTPGWPCLKLGPSSFGICQDMSFAHITGLSSLAHWLWTSSFGFLTFLVPFSFFVIVIFQIVYLILAPESMCSYPFILSIYFFIYYFFLSYPFTFLFISETGSQFCLGGELNHGTQETLLSQPPDS